MKIEVINTDKDNEFIIDIEHDLSFRGRVELNMKLNQKDRLEDLVSQIMKQLAPVLRAKVGMEIIPQFSKQSQDSNSEL